MSDSHTPCNHASSAYRQERASITRTISDPDSRTTLLHRLSTCAKIARQLPNGFVKKIVWDGEGGYPEHSWGYIQYSPRPYVQGYGCDGTTDECIHLLAATFCARLQIHYVRSYQQAYPNEDRSPSALNWLRTITHDTALLAETIIPPETTLDTLRLALSDLYQINNRSLVMVLENKFKQQGYDVTDWWKQEDRLRRTHPARTTRRPNRTSSP